MATWGKERVAVRIGVALGAVVLHAVPLASCSSDAHPAAQTVVGVQWADYPPTLQAKIDALAVAKDCDALQVEFNQADATNLATQNQFGHTNFELLKYIDDKQRAANCF